ncbi:MAG: isochorismatase family cysteine hydrolase [Actinomycetota bacterium]|nr:isochorismatase family cysteine hydrolase [Actinomycetota bacterium]
MAIDLAPHLDPAHTAVVALEVQQHMLDPKTALIPGVAAHAEAIGLVRNVAALMAAARRLGAPVVYVSDERREDGKGAVKNLMIGRAIAGAESRSWSHGPIHHLLTPQPGDISLGREHGMTGFYTTPLDAYLRNLEVTTVILVGVSANIAVAGTAIEAMNLGYRVIVPNDCIAGDPPEYVQQLLKFTIRNVAMVAPVQAILDHWAGVPAA